MAELLLARLFHAVKESLRSMSFSKASFIIDVVKWDETKQVVAEAIDLRSASNPLPIVACWSPPCEYYALPPTTKGVEEWKATSAWQRAASDATTAMVALAMRGRL
jgi:hypothetical protein